jgi:hypothetical protein
MKLELVRYEPAKHESIIRPWYEAKGDSPVVDWLPTDTTYLVYSEDHGFMAIGALLLTNSKICFLEHVATNKELSEFSQARAMRFVILTLEQLAKNIGFKVILGLVPEDHFSLAEFYIRQKTAFGRKLMRVVYKYF